MASAAVKTVVLYFAICSLVKIRAAKEEKEKVTFTGSYLIVAPKTIRPSLPYSVSVNILDTRDPVVVDLSIIDEKNATIAKASGRDFRAGQAQIVSFEQLPATLTAESQYRLHAKATRSSGKLLFEQEQPLGAEAKSRSTFVQTDKAIYKPGSAVHFRVIVVTPDLKAYKGKADIKISDPNENVIMQLLAQTFDGGVLGKEDKLSFQLSEEPPLGDWKIEVDVEGQKTQKSFTVDKYVLPKYEVSLTPPPYIELQGDVPINVSAKYTYGKGVAGTVTVKAEIPWYYLPQEPEIPSPDSKPRPYPPPSPSFSKTADLDNTGVTIVKFTHAELVEHKMYNKDSQQYNIDFSATVTEKFTGTQRTASTSVTAYKHVEKIDITKQADTFKPGLDFNITIAATTQDGKPLPANSDRNVFLTISYQVPLPLITTTTTTTTPSSLNQTTTIGFSDYNFGFFPQTTEIVTQQHLTLDSEGKALITLNPPLNATSLRLEAHYGKNDSEIMSSAYADASKSPTDSYLQLLAKSPTVKAGENIAFKIRITKTVPEVTVQVMSKGAIIVSKNVKISGQSGEISFPATSEMAPKSRIIAYAVRSDNKEILVDAMDFRVEGLFKNNVSIDVKPKRAEPNQTVSFSVKAAPKSYVGLLAVDQSVLLLKSGNDITSDLIESDIAGYDSGSYYYGGGPWAARRRKRMIWCRWCWFNIGGQDAASVFDNSGVIVFTDAYLYRQPPPPIRHHGRRKGSEKEKEVNEVDDGKIQGGKDEDRADGFAASTGNTESAQSSLPLVPKIRKSFPETWIWADSVTR